MKDLAYSTGQYAPFNSSQNQSSIPTLSNPAHYTKGQYSTNLSGPAQSQEAFKIKFGPTFQNKGGVISPHSNNRENYQNQQVRELTPSKMLIFPIVDRKAKLDEIIRWQMHKIRRNSVPYNLLFHRQGQLGSRVSYPYSYPWNRQNQPPISPHFKVQSQPESNQLQ